MSSWTAVLLVGAGCDGYDPCQNVQIIAECQADKNCQDTYGCWCGKCIPKE